MLQIPSLPGLKAFLNWNFVCNTKKPKKCLIYNLLCLDLEHLGGLLAGLVFEAGTASPTNSARAASREGEPAGVTFKSNTGAFGMRKSALKPLAVIAGQIPAS